jgi:predicted aldo/keto reductase-like oxidoreductase
MKLIQSTKAVLTHEEVLTILCGLAKMDPMKTRLDVMQNQDKSLTYILTNEEEQQ